MWPLLAVGAGLGALKNIGDQQAANNQRKAQAEIQRWSPWTGMQGQMVQDPSLMGNIATGTAIGSQLNKMAPASAGATNESLGLPKPQEFTSSSMPASAPMPSMFNSNVEDPWTQMYSQSMKKPSLYGR